MHLYISIKTSIYHVQHSVFECCHFSWLLYLLFIFLIHLFSCLCCWCTIKSYSNTHMCCLCLPCTYTYVHCSHRSYFLFKFILCQGKVIQEGISVFSFQPVLKTDYILSRNWGVLTPNGHVVSWWRDLVAVRRYFGIFFSSFEQRWNSSLILVLI